LHHCQDCLPLVARCFVISTLLLFAPGCGEPNPLGRRAVHGEVTFQGQPVDYGGIQFMPEDLQRGVSSGAMIEDGRYQIKTTDGLPPGNYKVMITAPDQKQKEIVEGPPGEERSVARERIPKKYNLQTELKLEVPKARGSQEANFNLE
jgi:hypothetical protein